MARRLAQETEKVIAQAKLNQDIEQGLKSSPCFFNRISPFRPSSGSCPIYMPDLSGMISYNMLSLTAPDSCSRRIYM